MRTKVCFKCGVQKPTVEFYKHPRMADGHLGKCKECTKADVHANYVSKREKYSAYDAERFQRPERKRQHQEALRRHRERHPERSRARALTHKAIAAGTLRRMPCEVCGSMRVQAHHDDYSKPLDVRWLCFAHHMEVHGKVVVNVGKAQEGPVAAE